MTEDNVAEALEPLRLPDVEAMAAVGLTVAEEIHAGHQSRVFHGTGPGGRLIIKLTDARHVDSVHKTRVEVLAVLARDNPEVVGPISIGSALVTTVDDWSVVCYPTIYGEPADMSSAADVRGMAALLARLHRSFRDIPGQHIPAVSALVAADEIRSDATQLIHGDFGGANVLATASGLRVIDFDDCGYGTVEFDIGNTLYMARFDAWIDNSPQRFDRFREWFVDGYNQAAATRLDEARLDHAISVRVTALERWLGDLANAPIGIRKATPQWQATLRSFIAYASGG